MADQQNAIVVKDVYKSFKLPHEQHSGLKQAAVNIFKGNRGYETQKVLKNISFEIKKGEFFGIVGRNGSGKSTLLKLLAGIYTQDKGLIQINGNLTPFIELGVGFNPELTGRENVYLNGALLGFDRKEMDGMYESIIEFAELENFMDQKLKNYSSGMQVRLAFSIAIRAESEVLVLDEVLAVGDTAFQRKCYDYFMALKKNKHTVVLVTHDMGVVRQYCDRAVMMEAGRVVKIGEPEIVAQTYQKLFNDELETNQSQQKNKPSKKDGVLDRWGDGQILAQKPKVNVTPEMVKITTTYKALHNVDSPVYGFTIYNSSGLNILEENTLKSKQKTDKVRPGDLVEIIWEIPNIFADGKHTISIACCDQSATRFYDWVNKAESFNINRDDFTAGVVDPLTQIVKYEVNR